MLKKKEILIFDYRFLKLNAVLKKTLDLLDLVFQIKRILLLKFSFTVNVSNNIRSKGNQMC